MELSQVFRPLTRSQFVDSAWTRSSLLSLLPTELLVQIFNHAGLLDQLALALTCKYLLQVSTFVCLKISSLTGKSVSCRRSTMEELLRIVRPLYAGRPKRAWHICVDCLQYRPTRKSYWNNYWKKKQASGLSATIWESMVAHWNSRSSLQCPECYYDECVADRQRFDHSSKLLVAYGCLVPTTSA